MLTMSGLPRFMICPASAVLPQLGRASEDGRRGHGIHDAVEGVIRDPDVEWAAHEHGEPVDMAPIRGWFPTLEGLLIEPKMAYDVARQEGRIIERPGARDYGELGPDEIPGSADLALWHEGTLYLADIKTGFHQDQFAGRAADNWQLRGLALALWWARPDDMPAGCCRAALLKVREDGRVDIDEVSWGPGDLADFAWELARAWAARGPRAVTSQWCGFCPSLLACPATRQAVELLAPPPRMVTVGRAAAEDPETRRFIEQTLRLYGTGKAVTFPAPPVPENAHGDPAEAVAAAAPEQVAQALGHWRHLRRIGDALEERGRLLAREGLLPGWRLVQRQRQELHGGTAHGTLRDLHGEQVAREGVEISTTKKLVKDALRAHLARLAEAGQPQPRGTLAKLEREALRLIAERGGAETRTYETLTEDIQEALCAPEEA